MTDMQKTARKTAWDVIGIDLAVDLRQDAHKELLDGIARALMEARDKALEDAAVVADEWAHDAETADAADEWYMGCATACRSFASKTRAMKSTVKNEEKP